MITRMRKRERKKKEKTSWQETFEAHVGQCRVDEQEQDENEERIWGKKSRDDRVEARKKNREGPKPPQTHEQTDQDGHGENDENRE